MLTYHRVLPNAAPLAITVEEFERHLQWLKSKGFRSLTGTEFERALRGELETQRALFITFDDGYLDSLYLATPLLKKYNFKASLFVITGKIHDRQARSIGSWNETGDGRFLSWEEIDAMVASGVFEVHSHTHTHTQFWAGEKLESNTLDAVCHDIAVSLKILRNRYSHDIQLAWPWGYFRTEWLAEIAGMGIKVCHTMCPGTNFPGCDLRRIRRLGEDSLSLKKQLLFSAASSPWAGRGLNATSAVWRTLRNQS